MEAIVQAKAATVRGSTILLQSGAYFDLLDPAGSNFTIDDIAHGLSHVCRFAGQCQLFYSVAQHSIHVSHVVDAEHAYAGLMHDAAEAFIGDVAKPLKNLLPDYQRIEAAVEAAIFDRFDVPYPLPEAVKWADIAMLRTEQAQLMRNDDDWPSARSPEVLKFSIPYMPSWKAKREFLIRFGQLRGAQ